MKTDIGTGRAGHADGRPNGRMDSVGAKAVEEGFRDRQRKQSNRPRLVSVHKRVAPEATAAARCCCRCCCCCCCLPKKKCHCATQPGATVVPMAAVHPVYWCHLTCLTFCAVSCVFRPHNKERFFRPNHKKKPSDHIAPSLPISQPTALAKRKR